MYGLREHSEDNPLASYFSYTFAAIMTFSALEEAMGYPFFLVFARRLIALVCFVGARFSLLDWEKETRWPMPKKMVIPFREPGKLLINLCGLSAAVSIVFLPFFAFPPGLINTWLGHASVVWCELTFFAVHGVLGYIMYLVHAKLKSRE